jgi:hypothetical protein
MIPNACIFRLLALAYYQKCLTFKNYLKYSSNKEKFPAYIYYTFKTVYYHYIIDCFPFISIKKNLV